MKKYVISHDTEQPKNEEIFDLLDTTGLFLKQSDTIINGKQERVFAWVDVHDCDKFDTKLEAECLVDTLPYKHTILPINIDVVKYCKNCLRNCGTEDRYLDSLDANGDKINHNCWFSEGQKYWDFNDEECPDYILNESSDNDE